MRVTADIIKWLLQSSLLAICCSAPMTLAEAPAPSFDQGAALYRDQNYAAALPIFLALAKPVDVQAQTVLAMMFRYGEGTPVDSETALSVYRLAAEAGHAPAQYQMGVMLRDGEGVTPNEAAALRWFQQAAQNGYDKARLAIEDLAPSAALHQTQMNPCLNAPSPGISNYQSFPPLMEQQAPRNHRLSEGFGFSCGHASKKPPLICGNFSNKNSLNSHPLYLTPLVSLSRTTKAPPYIDCAWGFSIRAKRSPFLRYHCSSHSGTCWLIND